MSLVKKRPNILLIVADQLSQRAVGAYGDAQGKTPNIDALAARGTRFANVYTPCPVCMPARASLWTGRMPHETGVRGNQREARIPAGMPGLGTVFAAAGYRCVHFGKRHDMGGLREFDIQELGEQPVAATPPWKSYYDTLEDRDTTRRVVEFLSRAPREPFLAVASYNNPHDICLWIGDHKGPHADTPGPGALPPLPDNFEDADRAQRPIAVRRGCCGNFRVGQTLQWTPDNFRHYLAAYYHYVEMLDREVGAVLGALAGRPDAADTLVVFLSDHGEGMASHRMVTKGEHFYEEVTRIPLIFAGGGLAAGQGTIRQPLVSLVDLMPTLCDWAGLDAPPDLPGRSLLPWLKGASAPDDRDYVVSTWYGHTGVIAPARMLRSQRHKYTCFREDGAEELYDLRSDPGERVNLAFDPGHADTLARHRGLLREHCRRTGDPFFNEDCVMAEGRRTHADGLCPFGRL